MNRRHFLQTSAAALTLATAPLTLPAKLMAGTADFYSKKTKTILGHEMAYVDEGQGRPIVFLHGNPASSYLWRGIIPYVTGNHRAIAPDLIGMGDSAKPKLENTYMDSAAHLSLLLDELDIRDAVLVVQDWGSALGWHYARTRPDRVSAVAFMEAMVPPVHPIPSFEAFGEFGDFLKNLRNDDFGRKMILEDNFMIDTFLRFDNPAAPKSDAVMAEYNRYYPTPESRQILLDWPREVPVAGSPADVLAEVEKNNDWLLNTQIPKLMFHADPGALIPMQLAEVLKSTFHNMESVFLGAGGHFLQEDHPDTIGKTLAEWLTRV